MTDNQYREEIVIMRINVGDFVSIWVNIEQSIIFYDCECLYVPSCPGDSWHFKTQDGSLIYVQNFVYMKKSNLPTQSER